jgi:hypothetical protein
MRFLSRLLAPLVLLLSLPSFAQSTPNYTTNVTLASLQAGGTAVANARVCATPADQYGNPITVSAPTWGLVLPTPSLCGTVTGGVLTGGLNVPDACHTNASAPIRYNFSIQVLTAGGSASGSAIPFSAVPNVCGPAFALEQYTPPVSVSTPLSNTVGYGTGVPSNCTSPSIWIPSDSTGAYVCHNGVYIALTGPQGPPVSFKGAYSASTTYAIGDSASYTDGSSYVSLTSGNTANAPPSSPTKWALLAAAGTLNSTQLSQLAGLGNSSTIGPASLATGSTYTAGDSLINSTPAPASGTIHTASVYAVASSPATLFVATANGGGTFTLNASVSVSLVAGQNTFYGLSLPITAGQLLGIYTPATDAFGNTVGSSVAVASTGTLYYAVGLTGTSTSMTSITGTAQVNGIITTGLYDSISTSQATLSSTASLASATSAALGSLTQIGPATPVNGGQTYDNGKTYLSLSPAASSGTVYGAQVYAVSVSPATLIVATFSGGTYTSTATASVSLVPGLNTFSNLSLPIAAGQYLGIYSAGSGGSPLSFSGTTHSCYTTGQISTSTAPTSCALPGIPQFNFSVGSGLAKQLNGDEQNIAANTAALGTVGATSVQGLASPANGTSSFGTFSYINQIPSTATGNVRSALVYTSGTGSITFFVATNNGNGTYTATATSASLPVNGAGLNSFSGFSLPITAGQYFGIYVNGIKASAGTSSVWYANGVVGTNTPAQGTFSNTTVPYNYTVTSGVFDTLAAGSANSTTAGAGIGLLAGADATGATDATAFFSSALTAHPSPYVPVGKFSLTSIPKHGQGFWGDGTLFVSGVRHPIWRTPHDTSLQLANRSALALQSSTGSAIILMGDSLFAGTGATVAANTWFDLYTNWINYGFAGTMLPVNDFFHSSADTTNQPLSFYGLTLSGNTDNSTGPINSSTTLAAGGSITFTGAYTQVDFFYDQSPSAGSVVMAYNGTTFKTVNTAGTATTDVYSGPTSTGQTASGTYTLTATGGPVVITGLVRQNPTALVTGSNPIYTMRASHGGFATTNFQTQEMASALKQATALGGGSSPEVIIDLITNDMAGGPSGLAAFQAGLARMFAYLQGQGANVKYVLPQYPPTNPNFYLFSGAAQTICRQYGVPVFRSDALNFGENPGLFYNDNLHWTDAGNAKIFEAYSRWRAEQQ